MKWIEDGEPADKKPELPKDVGVTALVAYEDGRVAVFSEHLVPQFHEADFHAVGSGNEIALGAMGMGATAEEAVRVACRFDCGSGEPVQIEVLPTLTKSAA